MTALLRRLAPLLCALLLALPAAAHAEPQTLAPVTNDTALSAYGGWVAWSEALPDGRWALTAWHDGMKATLPVAPRAVPFDVDLGPDEQGRPVGTYSRCAHEPPQPSLGPGVPPSIGYVPFNGLPSWSTGRGCRLFRLALSDAAPRERPIATGRPRGASETTPSQWRGMLAFGRRRRGSTVMQLLLLDTRTHRLRRLRPGSVPRSCPFRGGCKGARYVGEVQQADLGPRTLAYLWRIEAPSVVGIGPGWQLRGMRLGDGRSSVFGEGGISGTCGARYPGSPNAAGTDVVFDDIYWECDTAHSTMKRGNSDGVEIGPPVAWQLALDGADTYMIRGPRPPENSAAVPCLGDAAPCELAVERSAAS